MRRTVIGLFVVLQAGFLLGQDLPGGSPPLPVAPSAADALASFDRGELFEGVALLRQAIAQDRDAAPPYFYLSAVYAQLGRFDTAHRYIDRALVLDPDRGAFHHQKGIVFLRQRKFRDAIGKFTDALGMDLGTERAATWRALGNAYMELFQREAAVRAYREAVRARPSDARSRFQLGRIALEGDRPVEAVAHLSVAVGVDPQLQEAYPALARAQRRLGSVEASIATFRDAIERDPTDQESRYGLARTLMNSGELEEGRSFLAEYIEMEYTVERANALFDSAMEVVEAVSADLPLEGEDVKGKELIEELETVRDQLDEVRHLAPTFDRAQHALGKVSAMLGEIDEGINVIEAALVLNPLNGAGYRDLSKLYASKGDVVRALRLIERALVLEPQNDAFRALRSGFVEALGRSDSPAGGPDSGDLVFGDAR